MKYLRKFNILILRVFRKIRSIYLVNILRVYYGCEVGNNVKIISGIHINGFGKIKIGSNTVFGSKVILGTSNENAIIEIGENCFINGTVFFAAEKITLGNKCITSDCELMDTSSHGIHPQKRNDPSAVKIKEIIVKENVWIGSKAIVLPGAIIGDNSIIGVNSVVSGTIPSDVFAAGSPAKVIKKIS